MLERNKLENYQQKDNIVQIQSMNDIGSILMDKISQKTISSQPRKVLIKLDHSLIALADKVTKIVVGKYILEDENVINYVKNSINNLIVHLSKSKSPEDILNEYDPLYSDDLLLEVCRELFEYPNLPHMKKLLMGQFIINKSKYGDEIDMIYNYITSISLNQNIPSTIRMNAADILSLSNNTRYMKISKQSLNLLRQEQDNTQTSLQDRQNGQNGQNKQTRQNVQGNKQTRQNEQTRQNIQENIQDNPTTRITAIPHRIGETNLTQGERNDLFIIPPIIGNIDIDMQRILLNQFAARVIPQAERTVYSDNQNVHNTDINNSVLESAKKLIKDYRPNGVLNIDQSLLKNLPDTQRIKIESSIHRITTDPSTFKYGSTLFSIYQSLLQFISTNPHKDEINKRLIEELSDMSGLCSSGHASRLINVIQGFGTDADLKININVDEEIYAKIKHNLDTSIQTAENSDEIIDDITSVGKKLFLKFVTDESNKLFPDIKKEYKEVSSDKEILKSVRKALDKYTKTIGNFQNFPLTEN